MARTIKYLALHCTATQPTATKESILNYWKNILKWKSPGYHRLIDRFGTIHELADFESITNGVAGFNSVSIHISYIGGIDALGKPQDTRTCKQIESMMYLIKEIRKKYPNIIVQGHRDFGAKKACPSFDVKSWLKSVGL